MTDLTPENIDSRHDGFALSAVRARARGQARGGVVVIQEIFGVTPHIREMCGVFADAGYEALAPGMFDRIESGFLAEPNPEGFARGLAAVNASPWNQVAGDLQAAIDALPKPCFVTGFCWGGTAAWIAAARCAGLSGASCFYGRLIAEHLDQRPRVPVMLHYGARDANIPEENRAKVAAAVPEAPLYIYDAGHGFCRRGGHDYDEAATALALARTLDGFVRWGEQEEQR
ncbi:MAG TPA: dienelactone hydrolase family protein [Caulobacterales bacterium]|nr:dienelactone hydrolase family protein [Caulobacterales bacterium]